MGRPKKASKDVKESEKVVDEPPAPRRGRAASKPAEKQTVQKENASNKTASKANVRTLKSSKNLQNNHAELKKETAEQSKRTTATSSAEDKGGKTVKTKRNARNEEESEATEPPSKKARVSESIQHSSHRTVAGVVLTVGQGDTGQLGLGPDVQERGKPAQVTLPANTVQVCAGGMHTVCLLTSGEVYTFGCNDEGALGRPTKEEDDCMEPGKVDIPEDVRQVSAGDSHSAALSVTGQVYIWGTFRDANGPIGIFPGRGKVEKPEKILTGVVISKIVSGCDHLVCLTSNGDIYTLGTGEQGQLGRVAEAFAVRGGRRGLKHLLVPSLVRCQQRRLKFQDVWSGQYVTFAKAKDSGDIYAWGLNNYYQLGIPDMENKFTPEKLTTFDKDKDWKEISGGQHHTLALDKDGLVYSLGRKDYGRLGLGKENLEEKNRPTLVASLRDKKCVTVNCGNTVSFSVGKDGEIFGWGMGCNKQLAQGDDEDDIYEPKLITGKQLENKKGLMVSAGGQHTVFLAVNSS